MTRGVSNRFFRAACLAALLAGAGVCAAQSPGTARISDRQIASLQQQFAQQSAATSSTRMRRACKNTVRSGTALVEASPAAPNRFRVLAIMLQSQKRLLALENSDRNRNALFDTCSKLAEAPDEYAALRLEADMLLSEQALTLEDADVEERAQALVKLVERYRGTSAEAKSLMLAAVIAPRLEAFELKQDILNAMDERFPGDPRVIEWRRTILGTSELDVQFAGTYTRVDGAALCFPIDGMGRTCLLCFWSSETPDLAAFLGAVKALQSANTGPCDVFSFNLDELPDAGEKTLRARGLDWTVMRLPGGRKSQTYRAYARRDPVAVRVNAHGRALLRPTFIGTRIDDAPQAGDLDDARYLAQLQSLLSGEFLVAELPAAKSRRTVDAVPAQTLGAIQACFTVGPRRFRLTREQALANYQRGERLCRDAITRYPKAPDLWLVRNRRIIASLGMWILTCQPKHLEGAVMEARIALAATPPRGAGVVPRFCLAKESLRRGDGRPESVLAALIDATGGSDAPASAIAAAAILAMDAGVRGLHARYRGMLLAVSIADPAMWPVISFLRDQNHRFRLFKANYYHPPSRARRKVRARLRSNAAALDAAASPNRLLKAELRTLIGGELRIPRDTAGKLTLLLFMELPSDEESARRQDEIVTLAITLADSHVRKGIQVIAAFLCADAAAASALLKKNAWTCRAAMVPEGLGNPLVRRLGILSADRVPNVVLLRPDGTIAWMVSGVLHPQLKSEGIGETKHGIGLGMKANIELCELEDSLRALKKGDFQKAVQLLSGPFPQSKRRRPDGWTAPRLHGRALAHMALKNGNAALADIDAAIDAHQVVFGNRKPCSCQRVAELRLTKASIFLQLGQTKEAEAVRQRAATATTKHRSTRYGSFHDRLKALNIKERM